MDGIAFFPSYLDDDDIEFFAGRSGCPVVMIGRASQIPNVVSIALDEARAAHLIVNHLVDAGKSRIGLLMNELFPDIVHERFTAWQQAIVARTGVTQPPVAAAYPKIPQGRDAATRLLDENSGVDAIVAYNDTMAMGALLACRQMGLRVPEDVAVVGYDGIPFGAITDPPLTTIVQDSTGMADAAFKALLSCIDDGTPPDGRVLQWKPELLIRGST